MQLERKYYENIFFRNLLELIDDIDYSGKVAENFQKEQSSIPPLKIQLKKEFPILNFANYILTQVDAAWDSSVSKTANTINFMVVRPFKWGQARIRTMSSKIVENTDFSVSSKAKDYINRGRTQIKSLSLVNTTNLIRFGVVQPYKWG